MNTAMFRNLSAEEAVRYLDNAGALPPYVRGLVDRAEEAEQSATAQDTAHELADEQLGFARDLVEEIADCLDEHSKARDLKAAVRALIDDSQLEL